MLKSVTGSTYKVNIIVKGFKTRELLDNGSPFHCTNVTGFEEIGPITHDSSFDFFIMNKIVHERIRIQILIHPSINHLSKALSQDVCKIARRTKISLEVSVTKSCVLKC